MAQARNSITLMLTPQVKLPGQAKITFKGLLVELPGTKGFTHFTSGQPAGVLKHSYEWKNEACDNYAKTCGQLMRTVSADSCESGTRLILSFSVVNSDTLSSALSGEEITQLERASGHGLVIEFRGNAACVRSHGTGQELQVFPRSVEGFLQARCDVAGSD